MFAKDRVPQSLIDAVNKVLAVEDKKPEQLNEAFPTVADAQKRANEPKPSGGAGIKLGTRYGGGRQADEPEKDDDEPKARAKYGARKTRFTNTKLYKEDKWEGSKEDKEEDKKLAKKHGMTLTQWEKSAADKKHDMKEELKGKQHKIDANKNGKIDSQDFEILRSKKKKMTEGLAFAERLVESMYGKKSALPLDEKEMSDAQKKKREEIVMSMKKDTEGMKKRYGSRWKDVMYATATKQAMKKETYGEEVELDEAKKTQSKDEKDKVVGAVQAAMRKSHGNVIAGKAQLAAARLAAKVKAGMKEEVEEFEEEIDPDVRTKDALSGANKPTKQKDDVGPGSDGRSTKVKFKAGPMSEEKEEDEKEDEGHEDEKEDKALVKKMVKKDALKEEELEEGLQQTLRKYVPGYAKKQIDKKMDDQKFGRTDVDKDANFYRYKKIQDKLKKEEVEQIDELKKSTVKSYLSKTVDPVYGIPKSKEKLSQRMKGISAAHQRIVGNKPTSEEVEIQESEREDADDMYFAKKNKPKSLKSFMSMKKEMIGKAGMTSEKKDEE